MAQAESKWGFDLNALKHHLNNINKYVNVDAIAAEAKKNDLTKDLWNGAAKLHNTLKQANNAVEEARK